MTVPPTSTTEVTPQQLRLLGATDPAGRPARSRRRRQRRPGPQPSIWLDAHTREVGQSGIAEARRRLAEINRPPAPLIKAT